MSSTVYNGSLANTASYFGAHFATNMSLGNRPKSSSHGTEVGIYSILLFILVAEDLYWGFPDAVGNNRGSGIRASSFFVILFVFHH